MSLDMVFAGFMVTSLYIFGASFLTRAIVHSPKKDPLLVFLAVIAWAGVIGVFCMALGDLQIYLANHKA